MMMMMVYSRNIISFNAFADCLLMAAIVDESYSFFVFLYIFFIRCLNNPRSDFPMTSLELLHFYTAIFYDSPDR